MTGQQQQMLQQRAQWAQVDPVSLVHTARQTLYTEQALTSKPDAIGPLEEIISRFEQQCRAGAGSTPLVGFTAPQGSGSQS